MKKTLKNKEILALYKSLKNLPPHLSGARFLYAVNRSAELIKPVAAPLMEVERNLMNFRAIDKGMLKYEEERIDVVKTYAALDQNNEPLTKTTLIGGRKMEIYDVPEEAQERLEKDVENLQRKHKKAFDAEKKLIADFEQMLEETSEITVHGIALDLVPEEIQASLFQEIFQIIDEK